ncbi:antistasin-like [Haliotis rufescens]|uniref:antistasin-like n=1 Tax=Haliotis rufescens TaxID=6454 RepID=UPI00201F6C72|nr:antistasin-like [Haliotis rufescens]
MVQLRMTVSQVVVVFVLLGTLVCSIPHSRRGSCLLLCGDYVNRSCPSGYACKSNGCGAECMRTTYTQPAGCPAFECQLHCPLGYLRDSKGCESCKCDYSALAIAPGK